MRSAKSPATGNPPCRIEGCGKVSIAAKRRLCSKHYSRWQRHGDPLHIGGAFVGTTEDRFWHYTSKQPDGHWIWTGPVNSTKEGRDYGLLFDSVKGRNVLAHRYSYILHKGSIPDGTEPDHLCRIPRCVAPDCMEAVPHRTNVLRGEAPTARHARKTHCLAGHPYDIQPETSGKRRCRQCTNATARERFARTRGTGAGTGGTHRARTHCPKGHPYDEVNTYRHPKTGNRDCKTCRRDRKRKALAQ